MKTRVYECVGAVSTDETISIAEGGIHFRFMVRANSFEEAQQKAEKILDESFSNVIEFYELEIREMGE